MWPVMLIIPGLMIALGMAVSAWMGPFWVFPRYDPDYCYLLNGLNIAQWGRPFHADHPGTPVQMLVAVVILVSHTVAGSGEMAADVVANPERYLHLSQLAILFFAAASSAALGFAALRAMGSVAGALCAQLMGLAALPLIESLARVNPEPVMFAIAMLLGAACLMMVAEPSGVRQRSLWWSVVLGLLLGVGVATKITFAPVALVCLAAARGVRQWAVMGAAAAVSLALSTIPIWYRLEYVVNWIRSNAENAGRYGSGRRPHGTFGAALAMNLRFEIVLTVLLVVMAAVVVLVAVRRVMKRASGQSVRLMVLLGALLAAQVVIVLVMSKFPQPRYLVPALSLMPSSVAVLWMLGVRAPGRVGPALAAAIALGTVMAAGWSGWRLIEARGSFRATRDAAIQAEEVTGNHREANTIVYHYGTSGEACALLFASYWSAHRNADLILRRFPAVLYRDGRNAAYRRGPERLMLDKLRGPLESGELYYRAGPGHRPDEIQWETILTGPEGLHRAISPGGSAAPE